VEDWFCGAAKTWPPQHYSQESRTAAFFVYQKQKGTAVFFI